MFCLLPCLLLVLLRVPLIQSQVMTVTDPIFVGSFQVLQTGSSMFVWLSSMCGCTGWKGNLCERSLASCLSLFILFPCAALAVYVLLLQTFVLRLEFILSSVLLCFYSLELLLGLLSLSAFSRWPHPDRLSSPNDGSIPGHIVFLCFPHRSKVYWRTDLQTRTKIGCDVNKYCLFLLLSVNQFMFDKLRWWTSLHRSWCRKQTFPVSTSDEAVNQWNLVFSRL